MPEQNLSKLNKTDLIEMYVELQNENAKQDTTIKNQAQLLADQGGELTRAQEHLQQLLCEVQQAHDEVDAKTVTISDLEQRLRVAAPRAVAVAPPPSPEEVLGTIGSQNGMLLVGDTFWFENHYVHGANPTAACIMDFQGPNAKFLADKQCKAAPEHLSDGSYRTLINSYQEARIIKENAQKWLQKEQDTQTTIELFVLDSVVFSAREATKQKGAGLVMIQGAVALAAAKVSGPVQVTATRNEAGKVVALHLKF